jgi:hypothetical protein
MQDQSYNHPAAPARAIPLGEDLLVTQAKVCAQLRAALQVLEDGPFDAPAMEEAKLHLQGVLRVLFVAREEIRRQTILVKVQIGRMPREKQA